MKIGIISNLYPPFIRGGAELVATAEAEGLKKAWQHVFVISTHPSQVKVNGQSLYRFATVTKDEVNEIPVYRFYPWNLYYYLNDFKYPDFIRLLWHLLDALNIFSYWKVKKILEAEKPDVVITHNLMGLGFLIPHLLRKLKIKHLHTLHDVQLVTPSGLIIKDKERAWSHRFFRVMGYIKLMRKLMGSPDWIISPSKFLLDFYNREKFFPQSQKFVLPNPIKSLIELKKQANANLELLYLGQIHKAKGVLELIKNFVQLPGPHIRLHIIGVGPDLAKAKELAKGKRKIIFYGWLNNHDLWPLLSKMDVLVVPSLCYENSPTVISEALSMGLPVLVAEIGGAAELIKESFNGWIFPAGDGETMKKKIIGLYKQREKIPLMAANCQQSVAKYNLDNYVQEILKIINYDSGEKV
jgi:glycosyltransferase involved in cell wall biosynthesis